MLEVPLSLMPLSTWWATSATTRSPLLADLADIAPLLLAAAQHHVVPIPTTSTA